jgi:hypothetical protein
MTLFFITFFSLLSFFFACSLFVSLCFAEIKTWHDILISPFALNARICQNLQQSFFTPLVAAVFISIIFSITTTS